MGKKKILEIVGGEFDTSGSSLMIWKWYENFDLTSLQIDFFCLNQPKDYYSQIIAKNDGKCYVFGPDKGKSLGNKVLQAIALHKIAKENCYDCIHIHISSAKVVLLTYLLCKRYVKKMISHSHNTCVRGSFINRLLHNLCKYLLSNSKIIRVACSKDAAKWLFPPRIIKKQQYIIIKNGIDIPKFAYNNKVRKGMRKELNLEGCFVIGHIGRFVYQKNHSFLIDVFEYIHQKCPNAMLLLIGDGDSYENLTFYIKNKVKHLNLMDNVIFFGNTDKVNELYQAMDCFILPSHYEGLGIVLIEAQAAGLKILCADTIPEEAKITENLKYMSLNLSPEKWADELLSYNEHYERENTFWKIEKAGYNIRISSKIIENLYLS